MTMLTRRAAPAPVADMEHDKILQMRLSAKTQADLDELRRREADLPSRSEMIRRLIARAIEAGSKARGK